MSIRVGVHVGPFTFYSDRRAYGFCDSRHRSERLARSCARCEAIVVAREAPKFQAAVRAVQREDARLAAMTPAQRDLDARRNSAAGVVATLFTLELVFLVVSLFAFPAVVSWSTGGAMLLTIGYLFLGGPSAREGEE